MDMTSQPLYLSDEIVKQLLDWDKLVPLIEAAMSAISDTNSDQVVQPPRTLMPVKGKDGILLSMPAYSMTDDALACKLVTAFPKNSQLGLPSVMATILLFDSTTGKVSVIMDGNEITAWRTAAASVVATKYFHNATDILAILGSGTQARSHIWALDHFFKFKEIRVWNHQEGGAQKLADEFENHSKSVKVFGSAEDCVKDADVIVTTTFANSPILKNQWIKPGVHINAIGAGINHHSELDPELYQAASIFTDHMEAAKVELQGLANIGVNIEGEIGEIIRGIKQVSRENTTVFQSLGMAVEDVVSAKLIYEEYKKRNQ